MLKYIYRITIVLGGSLLMSVGIVLILKAGLGADPLTGFVRGLSLRMGCSYGGANNTLMGSVIVLLLFIEPRRIGWGTFLNGMSIGFFVDLLFSFDLPDPEGILLRILALCLGIAAMGGGIGVYISAKGGEGGIDALMMVLHKRMGVGLPVIRIFIDLALLAGGFFLDSPLGAGTFLAMALTGPAVGLTLRGIAKIGSRLPEGGRRLPG